MRKSKNGKANLILIGIIILVLAAVGLYFFRKEINRSYLSNSSQNQDQTTSTSNWKTITNSQASYTFKYPDFINLTTIPDLPPPTLRVAAYEGHWGDYNGKYFNISIEVHKGATQSTIDNPSVTIPGLKNKIKTTVDGVPAVTYFVDDPTGRVESYYYIFKNGDDLFTFILSASDPSLNPAKMMDDNKIVLDQIVSTFKFTN